mgnify:CR=1 FL=1
MKKLISFAEYDHKIIYERIKWYKLKIYHDVRYKSPKKKSYNINKNYNINEYVRLQYLLGEPL